MRASSESTEASTEARSVDPRLPRSTMVSGQRDSTPADRPEGDGRYEATCPARSASASAAPGPTVVEQPAALASSPQSGLLLNCRLYEASAPRLGTVAPGPTATTAGNVPQLALV